MQHKEEILKALRDIAVHTTSILLALAICYGGLMAKEAYPKFQAELENKKLAKVIKNKERRCNADPDTAWAEGKCFDKATWRYDLYGAW